MVDEKQGAGDSARTPADENPVKTVSDRVDVKGMIRQASKRVAVQDLLNKGTRTISVLSKDKIDELVNQAVKTIVAKYRALAAGMGEVSQELVEKESQEEFKELFQQYQETNRAKHALEQSASAMSEEIETLRGELEKQKALAEGKLTEEAEKMLVVGFKDFEYELNRIAAKVFEKRRMILEGNGEGPEAIAEFRQIEERLGAIIKRLIERQRDLFFGAGGRYARDREVAMLEKRLEKMYEQMKAMEEALKAISNQKLLTNQAVQNMLRGLGLIDDDQYAEKRKEMLKVVLAQNIRLRQDIKEYEARQAAQAAPGGTGGTTSAA